MIGIKSRISLQVFVCVVALCIYKTSNAEQKDDFDYVIVKESGALGCYSKKIQKDCFKVRWGKYILLSDEQKVHDWKRDVWFHVTTNFSRKKKWWIKTKHLVAEDDLIKLTKGWPIRKWYYDSGDYRFKYDFSENGEVLISVGGKVLLGHIFYAPDVAQIRYPSPTYGEIGDLLGYDVSKNKVYPFGCVKGELCKME